MTGFTIDEFDRGAKAARLLAADIALNSLQEPDQ